MAPDELAPQDFDWKRAAEKLGTIHSALQKEPGNAKKYLLEAFSCARSAANYSYESLSYDETVARGAGKDWIKFFGTFRKDAWDVYRDHSAVNIDGKPIDLLVTINDISKAANDVFWSLRDFFAPKEQDPVPSARRPAVEKLEMLILALKLAEQMLQPQATADVRPIDKRPGQEAPGSDQENPAEDRAFAADTPAATEPDYLVSVPAVTRVAAGLPSIADQSNAEVFPLNARLLEEGVFLLRKVTGEIPIDSPITNGDWIIVRSQSAAGDGDLVAVDIDGETTVRTSDQAGQVAILGTVAWVLSPVRGYRPGA